MRFKVGRGKNNRQVTEKIYFLNTSHTLLTYGFGDIQVNEIWFLTLKNLYAIVENKCVCTHVQECISTGQRN